MTRSVLAGVLAALVAVLVAGCSSKESNQLMSQGPRYEPLEGGDLVPQGWARRSPVPGTVARNDLDDDAVSQGHVHDHAHHGTDTALPFPVTRAVIGRGRERFDIYCSPCHGQSGHGDGMVVRRGFTSPPSLHDPALRAAPVDHFVEVMSKGFGAMPEYAKQIPVRDRWAIAAYIRALQLSQHARLDDLPPAERARLAAEPER